MIKLAVKISWLVIVALAAFSYCLAQTNNADLRVRVADPNGAVVTAAKVRLKTKTGKTQEQTTNARGEAIYTGLTAGEYQLEVEATGFSVRHVDSAVLAVGHNQLDVGLEVLGVEGEVNIAPDERERVLDPHGVAFSNVLTGEQIAQLPDDPEELAQALQEIAGPGSVIRVDGFRGGELPPKSQIKEIRFRLNSYASEYHDVGFRSVDITTKAGVENWHGTLNFGFRDEALNARNPLAPRRGSEQDRRLALTLDGPIWRNRTSLFLSANSTQTYDTKTVVAALPEGAFTEVVRRPLRSLNLSARVNHSLSQTQTARLEFQRNTNLRDNLGIGDFDLPERAFSTTQTEHILRVGESGVLFSKWLNEIRLQTRWQERATYSASDAPTIVVLGAFTRGGAQVSSDARIFDLELADNLDFGFGKHAMRAGVLLEGGRYHSAESRNANGTFVFSDLAAFNAAQPITFTQRTGNPSVAFAQYQTGFYWQDDFHWKKNLLLSFGARQEAQTNVGGPINISPRFGVAWTPVASGRVVVRGGAGIFYDWFAASLYEQTLRLSGERQRDIIVRFPGFPDPLSGGTQDTLPPSRIQLAPSLTLPRVEQFSLSTETRLNKGFQLTVEYRFQHGSHGWRSLNINAPTSGSRRPDPSAGNVLQLESSASQSFQGVFVNLSQTLPRRRLSWFVNYTLSKAVNETDNPLSLPADNSNLRAERGASLFDARHRISAVLNTAIWRDLRLGLIFYGSSATPYDVTTGFDNNGDTVVNDRPLGHRRNDARGAGNYNLNARFSWRFGFGEPSSGSSSAAGQIVRVSRNDPFNGIAGGSESHRINVEFYAQASNLLNHSNLINFSGVQTSPFFGQATAAQPARRIESGIRISF
jgi:Carboxypeptidase regulatory-like domain